VLAKVTKPLATLCNPCKLRPRVGRHVRELDRARCKLRPRVASCLVY